MLTTASVRALNIFASFGKKKKKKKKKIFIAPIQ